MSPFSVFVCLACLLGGVMSLPASETAAPVQVALAGDSTVQDYALDNPRRGWGQLLPRFLAPGVVVTNHAAGGRSTSTFRSEGRWERLLATHPQVVLIQFGHNDSHEASKPEAVEPVHAYPDNLRRYVAEARAAGVQPILVTPPPRRQFAADGAVSSSLVPYVTAMRTVAAETKTPCIDLFAAGSAELSRRGDDGSAELYCLPTDRTHFSPAGALLMTRFVVEGLLTQGGTAAALVAPRDTWPTAP
jgi:lysophospholipase L1-like esterase